MLQQSFNDGVVNIYKVTGTSLPGDKPKESLTLQHTLRYKERTVGFSRFYSAMQNNIKVALVIRCPQMRDVATNDVAIPVDNNQYRIIQIQYPEDIWPLVMDLTLEKVGEQYDIK